MGELGGPEVHSKLLPSTGQQRGQDIVQGPEVLEACGAADAETRGH